MPVAFPLGPQAPTPSARKTYRARTNDTIASIARQFGVSDAELMAANPTVNSITPGVALTIPAAATYSGTPMVNPNPLIPSSVTPRRGGIKPPSGGGGGFSWAPEISQLFRTWGTPYGGRVGVGGNTQGWNQVANAMPQQTAAVTTPQATTQPQGYQPTGWNAIASTGVPPVVKPADAGIPPGTPQKQVDEYQQFLDWFARDPGRIQRYVAQTGSEVPDYGQYITTRYSGGGGDFWQYMQDIQGGDITTSSGTGSSRQKDFSKYKAAQSKWKNNYSEVGVPAQNNYYNQGYSNYYSPNSFGVVTWRGW